MRCKVEHEKKDSSTFTSLLLVLIHFSKWFADDVNRPLLKLEKAL